MTERLSSVLVPIYKLFPLIPVIPMAYTAGSALTYGFRQDLFIEILFSIVWSALFYFIARNWRIVYLRENALVVYRLRKTVEIPVSQVSDVQASSWWGTSPRRITITLKSNTELGGKIVFVPRGLGYFAGTEAKRIRKLLNVN
jgi:hypothetical protein